MRPSSLLQACLLLCCAAGLEAAPPTVDAVAPLTVTARDWTGIRAAYDAGRHAIDVDADGDLVASTPGRLPRTASSSLWRS
jgi:hypothetical protein